MASRTLFLTVLIARFALYRAVDVPCLPPVENLDTDTKLEVALISNSNSGVPPENVEFLFSQVQCALQERYSILKVHRWHVSGDDCTILKSGSTKLNGIDHLSNNLNDTDEVPPTTLCETLDALGKCVENVASESNMRVVMALADIDSVTFTECGIFRVKDDRFRHFSSSAYNLKTVIFRFSDEVVSGLPSNLVVLPLNEDRDMDPPVDSKFELNNSSMSLLETAKSEGRMFATEMYDHFYALKRVANGLTPYVMPTTTTESSTVSTTTPLETTVTTQMPTKASTEKHYFKERVVELNHLEDNHNVTDAITVLASSTTPAPTTTTETTNTADTITNASTTALPITTAHPGENCTDDITAPIISDDSDEPKPNPGTEPAPLTRVAMQFGDTHFGLLYILFCIWTLSVLIFAIIMFIICLWPKYYHDEPVSRKPKKGVSAAKLLANPPPKPIFSDKTKSKSKEVVIKKGTSSSEKVTGTNTQNLSSEANAIAAKPPDLTTPAAVIINAKTSATNGEQSPVQKSTPDDPFAARSWRSRDSGANIVISGFRGDAAGCCRPAVVWHKLYR
uniref:Conserved plasma membrane protein n=1 Tax=Panagrellus redivivus TaxID=6233 RepID=A0A7E4ZW37_PANRE